MKNMPLAVQIWLVLASITLLILIGIWVFLPGALSDFFTQQVYTLLQDAQQAMIVMEGSGVIQFPVENQGQVAREPVLYTNVGERPRP